jgi:DNA-directed RNA polymerase subunit K/omega
MPIDNITGLKAKVPGGKYALTRAIAARAQQLQNGALPLTEVKIPNPITVAIDEVLTGKVSFEIKDGPAPVEGAAEAEAAAAESQPLENPELVLEGETGEGI